MRDFCRDFEKRLKRHNFKSIPPEITQMEKNQIVNEVYDFEIKKRFKSVEDRLLFRIGTWIDLSNIRTTNKRDKKEYTKFHTHKHKRPSTALGRIRAYSMGKISSKSLEKLDSPKNEIIKTNIVIEEKMTRKPKKEKGHKRVLSPSHSTIDLTDTAVEDAFIETSDKYGTGPKKKFRFLLLRKKEGSSNALNKSKNRFSLTDSEGTASSVDFDSISQMSSISNNINENNNINPTKVRLSIFDMDVLKKSLENLNETEFDPITEYEYDPENKKSNCNFRNKFHTVSGQSHDSLLAGIRKDSIKRRGTKSKLDMSGPIFYNPPNEAFIGQI